MSGAIGGEVILIELFAEGQLLRAHRTPKPLAQPTVTLSDIQPAEVEVRVRTIPPGWVASGSINVLFGAPNAISLTLKRKDPSDQGR